MTEIQRALLIQLKLCSGEGLWLVGNRLNSARQLRFMGFATILDLGELCHAESRYIVTITAAGRDHLRLGGEVA